MTLATQPSSALRAPPADAFPEWPAGWYVVAPSRELNHKPIAVELFGRRLACFRNTAGTPIVMDARCWHMGADLSRGAMIGDEIVCPFHGWRYDTSGKCSHIPSQAEIPGCARQQSYPASEFAGHVFVFPSHESVYPLPFFAGVKPDDLIAVPAFELAINCPWWLAGVNGFDLQHFAGAHDRRLVAVPAIDSPHRLARRIVATFEVRGDSWRDHLTRRFAGRRVTMDVTIWGGTLAFVMAKFHDPSSDSIRTTSFGMTEIIPVVSSPYTKSRVRVTIFRRRRAGLGLLDFLDVRIKSQFIRAFLRPDAELLDGAQYDPSRLIAADEVMIEYLRWLATASHNQPKSKESA